MGRACGGPGAGAGQWGEVAGATPRGRDAWLHGSGRVDGLPKCWARAGAGAAHRGGRGHGRAETGAVAVRAQRKTGGGPAPVGAGRRRARQGEAVSPSLGARRPARARQGVRGAKHARFGAGQGQGRESDKARWCCCWVVVGVSRSND